MCQADSEGALKPIEERIRQFLIARAKDTDPNRPFRATITYSDLCKAVDPDEKYWSWPRFRGIGPVLGRVSTWEHMHKRPMLSALVVQAATFQAGDGFAGLGRSLGQQIQPGQEKAFWRSQVEAVIRYWTSPEKDESASDPLDKARALLAKISGEVDEVRRLLGEA